MAGELKQKDNYTRDEFITANMGLVHSLCHRFTGRGIEYEDLYQAGCVGLIKATDNFDASLGFMFSTYAVPVILGEIKRLFRDGGAIKVGRSLKELSMKISREREILSKELGHDPTIGELAKRLEISPEEAAEALTAGLPPISLTYQDEDGSNELEVPTMSIDEEFGDTFALNQVLDKLSDTDKTIIIKRYVEYKTQSKVAKELGMTQVQVSRKEKMILLNLRKKLQD